MASHPSGGPSGEHRADSPQSVSCAVVTVSDTRTLENDLGGDTIVALLESADHRVAARQMIPDEPARMRSLVLSLTDRADVAAILLTGGTGISSRDQTYETLVALLDRTLPGYGEMFRMLSYREIGPAAMLSRAIGGVAGQTIVLSMPGSPAGVRLAMEQLILPEIGHLVREACR